ncbi:MAG: DivIVA domain-containing protein [Actinomycetota bacterium]|nr:DivIVA domain-containing protein [Actinomycetota bacterium]
MEAGETPTTPLADDEWLSGAQVRRATFPQVLRGYDREAVHELLNRVADWMEGKAGTAAGTPGMREEFAKVGERTAGILTAAEDAAADLREEAKQYADRLRQEADDESRKARLNASQRMDEMIADAETKAQRIIDDAVARRRQLNQTISSLLERRDEIAADAAKLADQLLEAVEVLRTPDPRDQFVNAEPERDEVVVSPGSGEEQPGEPESEFGEEPTAVDGSEEPTVEADSEETQIYEREADDEDERRGPSTLLVDPDAEDETPPRGFPRW